VSTTLVIPCFNEADRLPRDSIGELLAGSDLDLILVDDGSSDGTGPLLDQLAAVSADRVRALRLGRNRGKAEAVRQGMLAALDRSDVVGYADADFATPAEELVRLAGLLADSDSDAVIGSRVAMLGATIERSPLRHYLGRVFATGASLSLGRPVYDTQCGAKLFRVTPGLRSAVERPFRSRWAFDVELLGRLWGADPAARVVEVPLRRWADVGRSKVKPSAMLRTGLELVLIARDLRRAQR
jgi:dolichyl-phosphate beta-glucosyltransferase